MGRKKLTDKSKKITHATKPIKKEITPKAKEILKGNLVLIEIGELKEMPSYWMRGYSLQESDTIEDCCKLYEDRYNHEPLEGWLYTNKQGHRTLHLRITDEEKSSQL